MFALLIADYGFQSHIMFGGFDKEIVRASNDEVEGHYKNLESPDRIFWL